MDHTHGRQVSRRVEVYRIEQLPKRWRPCAITSLIFVHREGMRNGKPFDEQHYYLSNRESTAQSFARLVQDHWQIENGLHLVKDVTLKEDFPPRQGGHSPISWAVLNSFLITFARRLGARTLPQARRYFANQIDEVFRLLT